MEIPFGHPTPPKIPLPGKFPLNKPRDISPDNFSQMCHLSVTTYRLFVRFVDGGRWRLVLKCVAVVELAG